MKATRREVEILHGETGFFICLVLFLPFLVLLLPSLYSSIGTSFIQIYRESLLRYLFLFVISDDLLLFIFTLIIIIIIIIPMKLGIFDIGTFFSPPQGKSTDHNQFPTESRDSLWINDFQFYEMGNILHCQPTLMDDEITVGIIKQSQKGVPVVPDDSIPVSRSSDRKTCPRSPYRRSPLNEKQREVGVKSSTCELIRKLERKEMGKSWISMMKESKSLVGEWTLPTMDELVCSEQVLDPIPQCPVPKSPDPRKRETSRSVSKTESISTASTSSSYESTHLLTTEEETPPVLNGFIRRRKRRARAVSKSFGKLMELKSKDEETVSVDRYSIPHSKSSVRKNPPPPYKWSHLEMQREVQLKSFRELREDPNMRSEVTKSSTTSMTMLSESSEESTLFTTEEERSSSDSASSYSPKRPSLFKIQFPEDAFGEAAVTISRYRLPDGEWGFSFYAT